MSIPGIAHYLTIWGLSNPSKIASTTTSTVFRVSRGGDKAALKLLTRVGVEDESCGATALRMFDGVGAVRLLCSDEYAHLVEYADGPDLTDATIGDDRAADALAGLLVTLGRAPAPGPEDFLWPLKQRFRALFESIRRPESAHAGQLARGARFAEALLADPVDARVLHGDLHHGNVRLSRRGPLAIDPKGLYGESAYDAANPLCNPLNRPARVLDPERLRRHATRYAEALELPVARVLAWTCAHACLSAAWSLSEGEDPTYALRVAALAEHGAAV